MGTFLIVSIMYVLPLAYLNVIVLSGVESSEEEVLRPRRAVRCRPVLGQRETGIPQRKDYMINNRIKQILLATLPRRGPITEQ